MLRPFLTGTFVGAALSGAFYFIVNRDRFRRWFGAVLSESSQAAEQQRQALHQQLHTMTTLPDDKNA